MLNRSEDTGRVHHWRIHFVNFECSILLEILHHGWKVWQVALIHVQVQIEPREKETTATSKKHNLQISIICPPEIIMVPMELIIVIILNTPWETDFWIGSSSWFLQPFDWSWCSVCFPSASVRRSPRRGCSRATSWRNRPSDYSVVVCPGHLPCRDEQCCLNRSGCTSRPKGVPQHALTTCTAMRRATHWHTQRTSSCTSANLPSDDEEK